MNEPPDIDIKFNILIEKMDSLNEKYKVHAEHDVNYFDEIKTNIKNILSRLDTLEQSVGTLYAR